MNMHNFFQRAGTSLLIVAILITLFSLPQYITSVFLIIVLGYILVYEWPRFKRLEFTILYPVIPFICLIVLNHYCRHELIFLIVTICIFDTAAYLCGTIAGKHRIIPSISPKKTWEGLIGGLIISLICTRIFFNNSLIWIATLNLLGFVSDAWESYLKRSAHLKDSGTLLPGHGGLLDRFDSIMIPAVIMTGYYFLTHICP